MICAYLSIYIYMYMCVFLFDNMSLVWTNFPLGNSHLKKFSYFWLLFQSLAIAHPWGWCLWRNGLTSALSPRFAAYQDGHHGDTCQNNFKPCWCPLPKISFGYANDFFSGIYIYIYLNINIYIYTYILYHIRISQGLILHNAVYFFDIDLPTFPIQEYYPTKCTLCIWPSPRTPS